MNQTLVRCTAIFALLSLAACETSSHVQQRRRQVSVSRTGSQQERWKIAENDPSMVDERLRIALELRRYSEANPGAPVPEDVMKRVQQDVEELAAGRIPSATPEVYALADRWADEVLHQPALSQKLACHLAALPGASHGAHLRCGDLSLAAGDKAAAIREWQAAYEAATKRADQCALVDRILANSLNPERDMATFSQEAIARCRQAPPTEAAIAPPAEPTPAPAPVTGAPAAAVPPMAPLPGAAFIPRGSLQPGLELRADVVQPSGTVGSLNSVSPFYVGYGERQGFIGAGVLAGYGASGGSLSTQISFLGVVPSGRYYFRPREVGMVNGYVRGELSLAWANATVSAGSSGSASADLFLFGVMGAAGAEYLFNPSFGVTADFGLRFLSLGGSTTALSTGASVGLVLHGP